MNAFQIKIIAIITMVIDHLGMFFFPEQAIFRIIGRLSFPLFAFLIANGAHYTNNINKYIGRIFVFAVISQIPFYFAHRLIIADFFKLNILFNFLLALVAITVIRNFNNNVITLLVICSTAIIAYFSNIDYGAFGVLLTLSMFLSFRNNKWKIISFVILAFLASVLPAIRGSSLAITEIDLAPLLSTFALIFILLYNQKEGVKAKYLFYIFYPLQYVIFYLGLKFF